MKGEMRAAQFDRYGPPEVIYQGRRPGPQHKAGQVLVRVLASSVNGGELSGRSGALGPLARVVLGPFPKPVGLDFVGDAVEVGSDVRDVEIGQRVWGLLRGFGSTAEFVATDVDRIAPVPDGLSPVEAVTIPVATTAITALRERARLQLGERVLVRGATGGVGAGQCRSARRTAPTSRLWPEPRTSIWQPNSVRTRCSTTGRRSRRNSDGSMSCSTPSAPSTLRTDVSWHLAGGWSRCPSTWTGYRGPWATSLPHPCMAVDACASSAATRPRAAA